MTASATDQGGYRRKIEVFMIKQEKINGNSLNGA
jgi:hypothetical protein